MFQFDSVDLDFGVYRVLNARISEIAHFVNERLPEIVDEAFDIAIGAGRVSLEEQLADKKKEIKRVLGEDAFDTHGELQKKYADTPLGRSYLELKEQLKAYDVADTLKERVYNDLLSFFGRYYQEGDFISKRRIGRNDAYSIPYNGEEMLLYWANRDQYYIKTGEQFKRFSFNVAEGVTDAQGLPQPLKVSFELRNARVEQDNKKTQEKRYFVLTSASAADSEGASQPVAWDKLAHLTAYFEYRPLTDKEAEAIGGPRQQNPQDKLNAEAEERIIEALERPTGDPMMAVQVKAALEHRDGEKTRTTLGKQLHRFTARNSSDFFIHKDLHAFLARELDFYIKSQALQLDELISGRDGSSLREHVARARTMQAVALPIIDFLSQIEDFQKRLFEKKKFVVETNYCVTLDRIPEELYEQIAGNDAQRQGWVRLFAIDQISGSQIGDEALQKDMFNAGYVGYSVPLTVDFLKANPHLVLDTRFFGQSFTDKLLGYFDDLDNEIDGMLINSENFQALNLLQERYRDGVKHTHIDPPYNTATSGFLYKNTYEHSSWLAMMADRIDRAISILAGDGSFVCHIDENEYERLQLLLDEFAFLDNGTIVWNKKNPMLGKKGVATQHEYICWRSFTDEPIYLRNANVLLILNTAEGIIAKHGGVTATARQEFAKWVSTYPGFSGGERAYKVLDDNGNVYRGVAMGAPEFRADPKFHVPLIHPVTRKPSPVPPNGWSRTPETLKELVSKDEIIFGPDETVQPTLKVHLTEQSQRQLSSVLSDAGRGKSDLEALGLEFPYNHPVSLYVELIGAASHGDNDLILDYFAGSGTTGHAVIKLNREDGGKRKYILVEMGDYFNTVTVPRIQKVIYSKDWKDGSPLSREGTSHMFKYIRLESYEDSLNNIQFTPAGGKMQEAARQIGQGVQGGEPGRDQYLLRYMLDLETRGSSSLLSVEGFKRPFDYRMLLEDGEGGLCMERAVDLVETFNYLLGLQCRAMRRFEDKSNPQDEQGTTVPRVYKVVLGQERGSTGDRPTLVVWRTVDDLLSDPRKLRKDAAFIKDEIVRQMLKGQPEGVAYRLLTNGGVCPHEAEAIEPRFKAKMFE